MLRLHVSMFFVAVTLACAGKSSCADEPDSTASAADTQSERLIAIAYSVENLPVWRLGEEGQPQFDATVVIAYLRNYVDATTHIAPSAKHNALAVVASESDHDVIRRALTPLWAFGGNIANRLQQKLSNAETSNQKVLVLATDPNSTAVKRFFDLKFSDDFPQLQESFRSYVIQCVRSDQSGLLTRLGLTVPHGQDATLAILDNEGKLAAQVALNDLGSNDTSLATGLREFLELHRPEFANARDELTAGYDQAVREQKHVLVQLSGPNCSPCIQLTRFLEAQRELIAKDYVCVKLDMRMPSALEVIERIRGDAQGPVPWMAVLAADGEVLATGDGPDGNIGYPRTKRSKDHFEKMLRQTSQRLTVAEIATIMEGLGPTIELGAAPVPSPSK